MVKLVFGNVGPIVEGNLDPREMVGGAWPKLGLDGPSCEVRGHKQLVDHDIFSEIEKYFNLLRLRASQQSQQNTLLAIKSTIVLRISQVASVFDLFEFRGVKYRARAA